MKYEQIFFIKDASYFDTYEVSLIIFLIFSIYYFFKSVKFSIKLNQKKEEPNATNSLMVSIFIFFIVCIISFANILAYNSYLNIVKLVDNKKYHIIEGKVSNYVPMNITDKKFESFFVNNIKFIYSPAIIRYGFSKIKGQGNPIEEGDNIRIWYHNKHDYNNSKYWSENLILKLEWVP